MTPSELAYAWGAECRTARDHGDEVYDDEADAWRWCLRGDTRIAQYRADFARGWNEADGHDDYDYERDNGKHGG